MKILYCLSFLPEKHIDWSFSHFQVLCPPMFSIYSTFLQINMKDLLAIFTSIFQKPEKYDKKYFSCQNFTIFIICTLYLIRIDKILGWKLLGFIFLFHFLQIKLKDLLAFFTSIFQKPEIYEKEFVMSKFYSFYNLYIIPDQDW